MWQVPSMLLRGGALSIQLSNHLPRMLPWFALFARSCSADEVRRSSMALGGLLKLAEQAYEVAWEAAGVNVDGPMREHASVPGTAMLPFASRAGFLIIQRSEQAMRDSEFGAELRRRGLGESLRMERLSPDEVMEVEPNLGERVALGGAWWFPDAFHLNEPAALLRAMAAGVESSGGEVRADSADASVVRLSGAASTNGLKGEGVMLHLADGSSLHADTAVIAAGAHSKGLVSTLGEWCPLDTERGHHVTFGSGSKGLLRTAVCDPANGFIATPMAGGLRAAGTVQVGSGVHAPLDPSKCDHLEQAMASLLRPELLPALGARDTTSDWLGFRPSMPDPLPVIGRSARVPSVVYAFGHQHVGWTLGGITGQLVAEIITGVQPAVDLTPFGLERFRLFSY